MKKIILVIFVFLILFISILAANRIETYNYTVNLLFIPALDLQMKISDTGSDCKKLEFVAGTNSVFDKLYKVNNYYKCIYDEDSYLPESREKIIRQPQLKHQVNIEYKNQMVYYAKKDSLNIPPKTYSLLSMLMFLRSDKYNCKTDTNLTIEVKGGIYSAKPRYFGEETLELNDRRIPAHVIKIGLSRKTKPLKNEKSDIFFDNITDTEGERIVWIEKGGQKRILKAKFSVKKTWLTARLKEEKD